MHIIIYTKLIIFSMRSQLEIVSISLKEKNYYFKDLLQKLNIL